VVATFHGRETRDIFRYVDDARDALAETRLEFVAAGAVAVSPSIAIRIY
jgi:hypothetical protein